MNRAVITIWRRLRRRATLLLTLLVVLLVVPDSARSQAELLVVSTGSSTAVDMDPDTVWVLAVGSDARPGGNFRRSRGDAIQLVGINTKSRTAAIIGVPRDSWVSIPGRGSGKINSALEAGGPAGMADAVGDLIGIQPDYVVVTRFNYFIDLVDSIGGFRLNNPSAFRDVNLKPKGFKAGRIHLNGYNAMAYSRIRYPFARGDFQRSANQQKVIVGIAGKVRRSWDKPGFFERGVLTTLKKTATNLSPTELFRLGHAVALVKPSRISRCVLRGSIGNVGAASVVFPDVRQARRLGRLAQRDATLESCR